MCATKTGVRDQNRCAGETKTRTKTADQNEDQNEDQTCANQNCADPNVTLVMSEIFRLKVYWYVILKRDPTWMHALANDAIKFQSYNCPTGTMQMLSTLAFAMPRMKTSQGEGPQDAPGADQGIAIVHMPAHALPHHPTPPTFVPIDGLWYAHEAVVKVYPRQGHSELCCLGTRHPGPPALLRAGCTPGAQSAHGADTVDHVHGRPAHRIVLSIQKFKSHRKRQREGEP